MTPVASKNRIIFIDLIRAFAVINMVQGHTIDVLLAESYKTASSFFFYIWHTNRGFTAPIFMFTAGTVFTYLLRLQDIPFADNIRVKRGLKRGVWLIILAYLLRFPTPRLHHIQYVTETQWKIFFTVDVLHLIGIGLVAIIFLAYISEKIGKRDLLVYPLFTLVIIVSYIFTERVNWLEVLHPAIAGYFSLNTGSFFPIFPFLAYMTAGATLGSFLALKPDIFRKKSFTFSLLLVGIALLLISYGGRFVEQYFTGQDNFWGNSPNLVFFRLGIVVIFTSFFTYIAANLETIPKVLVLLGRNTLLIYVVHIMILYGSPINVGVYHYLAKSFSPIASVVSAIVMVALMTLMVVLLNKLRIKNKALVT